MGDGSVFEGLLDEQKSFKLGVLKKEGEFVYEGTFENNKMSGHGKFYDTKAELKFEGQFSNGQMHGYVVVLKKDRLIFEGVFENGNAAGAGVAYDVDYKVRGTFKLENSNKKGELVQTSGQSFKGKFKSFFPYKGTMTYTDGKIIDGCFEKGKANGKARITYPNGDIYEGMLTDDFYEGEGKLSIAAKSLEFTGSFKKGKKNGKATAEFNDRLYYEGNFLEDAFDGKVTFHRNPGEKMTIEFEKGQIKSEIEITFPDGSHFKSNNAVQKTKTTNSVSPPQIKFDSNVFDIPFTGTLNYPNFDRYEGQLISGLREGNGKYIFAKGDVFTGTYVKDKAEGEGKLEFKGGSFMLKGTWKDDLLDGLFLLTEKKKLIEKQMWRNGQLIKATAPDVLMPEKESKTPKRISSRAII